MPACLALERRALCDSFKRSVDDGLDQTNLGNRNERAFQHYSLRNAKARRIGFARLEFRKALVLFACRLVDRFVHPAEHLPDEIGDGAIACRGVCVLPALSGLDCDPAE